MHAIHGREQCGSAGGVTAVEGNRFTIYGKGWMALDDRTYTVPLLWAGHHIAHHRDRCTVNKITSLTGDDRSAMTGRVPQQDNPIPWIEHSLSPYFLMSQRVIVPLQGMSRESGLCCSNQGKTSHQDFKSIDDDNLLQ